MPLINIIVPVYNVEKYLNKCVDSILVQTYKNIRVILVDDGSPDACPQICDEYAKKDSRVIVIHRENGGLSAARNSGLDRLWNGGLSEQGDYVAFVDSDDYVAPDYIAFLYWLLTENDADIAQCGHYVVFSENRKVDKNAEHHTVVLNKKEAIESLCYNGIWDVTACNKLYKLSVFKDLRFPEGKLYEDTATSYLVVDNADRLVVNMEPLYYYVQRYESIANGVKWKKSKYQFLEVGDMLAAWVTSRYPDLKNAANVKRVYVRLSTLSQMVNCNHYDPKRVEEMRQVIKENRKNVLKNQKVSKRCKLGVIAILLGWPFYKIIWKTYYRFVRRK